MKNLSLSCDSTWTSAFLPHNWLVKPKKGLEVTYKKFIIIKAEVALPPVTFTLCFLTNIHDIRAETEWASCYLFVCAGVFWGAELLDELCRKWVMNPHKRAAELRWDTPWPVLGDNALYSTGPQTWYLFWGTAGFLQLKTSEKSDLFPAGGALICTPPLVSQKTGCNHNNSSRKRHLSSSSASPNPPVSPSSARLPLSWLQDWNGSYQIQKANVGCGWLPQACWCSQYSGSRLFIKHLPSQMSTEIHNGQTWSQMLK